MVHQRIYRHLQEVARSRDTTTYAAVAPLAALGMDDPSHRAEIAAILDEINRMEHAAGRPLLSAVVLLAGDNMPGKGFFSCARNLGLYMGSDDLAFWAEELRKVHG